MKKTLRVLGGSIAVALLTAVPTLGQPNVHPGAQSGRFTYIGGDTGTYVPAITSVANDQGLAPLGYFSVIPQGQKITVTIDDVATTDGLDIYVYVGQSEKRLFKGCIPVRTETTITGALPGQELYVFMSGAGYHQGCSAFATSGVVTVGGVN